MPVEPTESQQTAPPATAQARIPAVVAVFTSIASQAALVAALLYFFGRVHVSAEYGYFGIDANSLGFSTSDYVINSLNATLPSVMICALAILALLAMIKPLDRAVVLIQQRPRMKRIAVLILVVVLVACTIIVLNGVSNLSSASKTRGYLLAFPVLGIAAAVFIGRRLLAPTVPPDRTTDAMWSMMIAAFALAGVLWVTDLYVGADGNRAGQERANTLRSPTSSDFVLYSASRLAMTGTGI